MIPIYRCVLPLFLVVNPSLILIWKFKFQDSQKIIQKLIQTSNHSRNPLIACLPIFRTNKFNLQISIKVQLNHLCPLGGVSMYVYGLRVK